MVYLIHLSRPLHHAKHCIVSSGEMANSRILRACRERGIEYTVAVRWLGGDAEARKIRSRKRTPSLCPVCIGAKQAADCIQPLTDRLAELVETNA